MSAFFSATETDGSPLPSLVPASPTRFTLDGSDALEARLAGICERAAAEVRAVFPQSSIEGLMLGGGYGRGEGGVWRTLFEEKPYNDLEFYLCFRGHPRVNEWRFRHRLERLERTLTAEFGIDIEFKFLSLARLRHEPVTMFSYDLVTGHRWAIGEESLLSGGERHLDPARIPDYEAVRLLFNRCSGLLFAEKCLNRPFLEPIDADFVGRNLAKARLGFGDSILAACGQYHWSCRERQNRLQRVRSLDEPPWLPEVIRLHLDGVQFKLHPAPTPALREDLALAIQELKALALQIWLWLESHRLGRPFRTAIEYAGATENRCPEVPWWKCCALNARWLKARESNWSGWLRYPRHHLFGWMTLMLAGEPLSKACPGSPPVGLDRYATLWRRFR